MRRVDDLHLHLLHALSRGQVGVAAAATVGSATSSSAPEMTGVNVTMDPVMETTMMSREDRLARLRDLLRRVETSGDPAARSLAVEIRNRISAIEVGEDPDEDVRADWIAALITQVDLADG